MKLTVFLITGNIVHVPFYSLLEWDFSFSAVDFGADPTRKIQTTIGMHKQFNTFSKLIPRDSRKGFHFIMGLVHIQEPGYRQVAIYVDN
jgi:hypothetical protein